MQSLSAAQRSKIRRLSQPKELAPDEEGGELNIVPFLDIIVNILIFVLATVAVTFTATITTDPPASSAGKGGTRSNKKDTSLNLTVVIVDDGFAIKTSGANIAPGCDRRGAGIAVPKLANGKYDVKSLRECVIRLKNADPAFKKETQAFLMPNFSTQYQTIVEVMDVLRCQDDKPCEAPPKAPDGTPIGEGKGKPLFPDINFRVPL